MAVENIPRELWGQIDWNEWGEFGPPEGEIRGIIENGEIVAWYVIEREQTHVGPFRVKDERQGFLGGLLIRDAAEQTPTRGTYIATTTDQAARMCEKMGMQKIDGTLWVRS